MKNPEDIFDSVQIQAFNAIEKANENVLILGSAGSGKSTFISNLKMFSKKNIICVGPTAIAALNIHGSTIHSLFKIKPGPFIHQELLSLKPKTKTILREAEVLLIDEVSMVAPDLFDAMDKLARRARGGKLPFGGLQVVLVGDLYQLPPVITSTAKADYEEEYGDSDVYFFNSKAFAKMKYHSFFFEKIYRQTDIELLKNLNKLRNNDTSAIKFFNECRIEDPDRLEKSTVLTPYRKIADLINIQKLREIKSKEYTYSGILTGTFSEKEVPVPIKLKLKVGALVMFVKNHEHQDYYNGSLGIITDMQSSYVTVKLLSTGLEINVFKTSWEKVEYNRGLDDKLHEDVIGTYSQLPLALGYAVTIHKAQGKTLDSVILYMTEKGAFAHGQTYVALSRTRSAKDIHIQSPLKKCDLIFDEKVLNFIEGLKSDAHCN